MSDDFEWYGEGAEQKPLHTGERNIGGSKAMRTADDLARLQELQWQKLGRDVASLAANGRTAKEVQDLFDCMDLG